MQTKNKRLLVCEFRWFDLIVVVITTILSTTNRTTAQSMPIVENYCPNTTLYANGSAYESNLNTLLHALASNSSNNPTGFHNETVYGNTTNDHVYGLFLCRGDQNSSTCHECVTTAITQLSKTYCPNRKIAAIWYDECMVRYSNKSIFDVMDVEPCLVIYNKLNVSGDVSRFVHIQQVDLMIGKIQHQATQGGSMKKFAVDSLEYTASENVYGLGQCTPDLKKVDCLFCLATLLRLLSRRSSAQGGRVLAHSCIVRYELYPFFDLLLLPIHNSSATPSKGTSEKKRVLHILVYVSSPIISIVIVTALCFGVRKCIQKWKATQAFQAEMDEMTTVESLRFELSTIRSATSNFSSDNKVGEGGFGQVHKGKFEGGQEIAVKRLSRNSKQGIAEFKTELVVVAKLQHKNLVKLLGYCVTRTEKILIYEFLSKSSLDRFLFEPANEACLDWETRFNIILGIARGLLYLHEDSRVTIIHRDLKSSNILLDKSMNPKIADFGLAKLCGVDEAQGDTKRIVGTYGYMAPEYAITGHYSVKSDGYSFGVILLEIVSGQRSIFFRTHGEEALLHRAWRLWNENKVLELVDSTLRNNFPSEQVMQCIQIGLLCIQENAAERPRMTSIVAALNGQSVSLATPKTPEMLEIWLYIS